MKTTKVKSTKPVLVRLNIVVILLFEFSLQCGFTHLLCSPKVMVRFMTIIVVNINYLVLFVNEIFSLSPYYSRCPVLSSEDWQEVGCLCDPFVDVYLVESSLSVLGRLSVDVWYTDSFIGVVLSILFTSMWSCDWDGTRTVEFLSFLWGLGSKKDYPLPEYGVHEL